MKVSLFEKVKYNSRLTIHAGRVSSSISELEIRYPFSYFWCNLKLKWKQNELLEGSFRLLKDVPGIFY